MFDGDITSEEKFCPDWLADSEVSVISRWFPGLVAVSLLAPALIGGLWSMSWQGAVTAFFWATLVRIAFLHHITWSINSICHTFGKEEFEVRDKSRNVSWLAILSFGESWHNLHHADPTCARHGVLKGQIDIAARTIWLAEKLGWVYDVRWPDAARLAGKQTGTTRELGVHDQEDGCRADRLTGARAMPGWSSITYGARPAGKDLEPLNPAEGIPACPPHTRSIVSGGSPMTDVAYLCHNCGSVHEMESVRENLPGTSGGRRGARSEIAWLAALLPGIAFRRCAQIADQPHVARGCCDRIREPLQSPVACG